MRVGIVNVTGYVGAELARLLARHSGVELVSVTGRSAAGQSLSTVYPHLAAIERTITAEIDVPVDLAFLALPHHASAQAARPLLEKGARVIDTSADFRLHDQATYEQWYGPHPEPDLLTEAIYGLPEIYARQISAARLVANPGCYPTSAILALAPALTLDLIEPDVIVDAKSGVSGAGRTLSLSSHYSEVNESVRAYGLEGHRHLPEIVQELNLAYGRFAGAQEAGSGVEVTFVPHLVPMTRGILATCYAPLARDLSAKELQRMYAEFYQAAPFVRVVDEPPQTKQTWGSNYCYLHPLIDPRAGRLVVVSAIDNLVKGAAGQAIQNMNLMLGYPETTGLEALPIFP